MAEPLLQARGITKSFGHVRALRGAGFDVNDGEVVALIGDNGAGKSTLVKILAGVQPHDDGQLLYESQPVAFNDPTQAQQLGIETVFQDLALAPDLDPAANLFLGRELVRAGARAALVTAGAAGAALVEAGTGRWLPGVAVKVVNPIGAGDSLVGGYLHARGRGVALLDAVISGMATASASCEQDLAGGIDGARVTMLETALRTNAETEVGS